MSEPTYVIYRAKNGIEQEWHVFASRPHSVISPRIQVIANPRELLGAFPSYEAAVKYVQLLIKDETDRPS